VLDPKGKVDIVKKNGKDVILTEKEFKEFQKTVQRKMYEVVHRFEINYNCAADRHKMQVGLNNDNGSSPGF
jgi:hypothetical protein